MASANVPDEPTAANRSCSVVRRLGTRCAQLPKDLKGLRFALPIFLPAVLAVSGLCANSLLSCVHHQPLTIGGKFRALAATIQRRTCLSKA